eukprot:4901431-Alexandrium_andersonii.AAC.1
MLRLLIRLEIALPFTTHALYARTYHKRLADMLAREAHDVFTCEMQGRGFERVQAGLARGALID